MRQADRTASRRRPGVGAAGAVAMVLCICVVARDKTGGVAVSPRRARVAVVTSACYPSRPAGFIRLCDAQYLLCRVQRE